MTDQLDPKSDPEAHHGSNRNGDKGGKRGGDGEQAGPESHPNEEPKNESSGESGHKHVGSEHLELDNLPESFAYIEKLVEAPAPDDEQLRHETEQAQAEAQEKAESLHEKVQPYIAFDHVCKSFGDFHVLKDVSFFVNAGETLCILGRSGVGKSVSLQQLMGFYKPDSGCIFVAGEDITGMNEEQMQMIRRKVTMVFQNGALFDSLSIRENVAFSTLR